MYVKQLFYYAKKALRRLWRIVTLRPGAYGAVGKHNSYRGCRINEAASVGSYNYFGPGCLVNYADIGNYCSFAPTSIVAPAEHSLEADENRLGCLVRRQYGDLAGADHRKRSCYRSGRRGADRCAALCHCGRRPGQNSPVPVFFGGNCRAGSVKMV